MEKYLAIKQILVDNDLCASIALEIVNCVLATDLALDVTDPDWNDKFVIVCRAVRRIYDKAEKTYTQLIADEVVRAVCHVDEDDDTGPEATFDELDSGELDDEIYNRYMQSYECY